MSRLGVTIEAILELLDGMEVRYAIGGSLASSVYGLSRSTTGIDIIADLATESVPDFVELARSSFYVDQDDALNAVARGRSFNLIHLETSYKVDIFPVSGDRFRQVEIQRRIVGEFPFDGHPVECAVTSIEDTILAKLRWFQQGKSARQWEDLLGMLAVSGENLDRDYLAGWAQELEVSDLLDRLLAEAETIR